MSTDLKVSSSSSKKMPDDDVTAITLSPPAAVTSVTAPAPHKSVFTSNPTTWTLIIWQAAMIILFATCTKFPPSYSPGGSPSSAHPARYSMWMDTHTSESIAAESVKYLLRLNVCMFDSEVIVLDVMR